MLATSGSMIGSYHESIPPITDDRDEM